MVMICASPNYVEASTNPQDQFSACGAVGSTTLFDLKKNIWFTTDPTDAEIRTLPASTYKIFHSLIALDTRVTTSGEIFKWDGVKREFPIWNQDTSFKDAFKNSTVWVYEVLAHRIDKETYKRYLRWADYEGNGDIDSGQRDNFWLYGDWGVSPKDQIRMLVKLYKNELPFSRASMDTVKSFMCNENTCGKTGWTQKDGRHIGWWIGYVDSSKNSPLFFATRISKSIKNDMGNFLECRKSITDQIIKQYQKREQ